MPKPSTAAKTKSPWNPLNKQTLARINVYVRLVRLDRPIGIYLLLWPVLWALWWAAEGWPDWRVLLVFVLGTILMRSAGCAINDFADRDFDPQVERTRQRPLASGELPPQAAVKVFVGLALLAFVLVLSMNPLTIYLSFGGVLLAAAYPFAKRYTYMPQVVLGAAFAWGVPMAWTAQTNSLTPSTWLAYTATLIWAVIYDTLYAMVDRDDDIRAGIKSTAILFAENDRLIIGILQVFLLVILLMLGLQLAMGVPYYLGLALGAGLFAYHQQLIRDREPAACFKAFLHNHWFGMAIFAGIFCDYLLRK